jgi:carbon monoxide dehydrogenase subunit G
MATIRKEVSVNVPAAFVWDALRDVGNVHTRVAKGFVTDCRLDGDARIVTFVNGAVVREPIVTIEDDERRLVWSAVGGGTTHYNSSAQVFPDGDHRSRIVWTSDLLPNEMAATIGGMMELGIAAMKKTLEE